MANYKDYMIFDKLPHTWCAGCGHGIILQAIADALAHKPLQHHFGTASRPNDESHNMHQIGG